MNYNGLRDFVNVLESAGELIRINVKVSSQLEIAEITDRVVKSINKALLFEDTGTEFPLLINAFGSEKRICLALGVDNLDEIGQEIDGLFKKFTKPQSSLRDKLNMLSELKEISSWMPKKLNKKGICQQVVMQEADLSKLPILKCWPFDGGSFITLPVVHTVHPETGVRNVGMYRMQVYDNKTTGMHWHIHKDSAKHYKAYKELDGRMSVMATLGGELVTAPMYGAPPPGRCMPVSVTLGGDPVYTYVASAPLPENLDEYILAGFLRKKKVELVKCLTNDIYVPADADFVIEGYVDVKEDLKLEGPFGDHTGFYSLADYYPVFHVTCITHRKDAIYPATIVGIPPQEDAWLGKATERIFLAPIRLTMLPELIDMNLPIEGVFHNIAIVKSKKLYEGHPFKIMNALWGAGQMMLNKMMIIVDESVDINNYSDVFNVIYTQVNPSTDIILSKGPLDVLDHSADITGFGGKLGIDATSKNKQREFNNSDNKFIIDEITALKAKYSSIIEFNSCLLTEGSNTLILSVEKKGTDEIKKIVEEILENKILDSLKFIVFIESLISPYDLMSVVWRSANNVEPSRDCNIIANAANKKVLVIDATMKNKKYDNFNKNWPNIITSSAETINLVDQRWETYGLGSLIKSPSLKYASEIYNEGECVR